ncbi:MAG: hypothetical protein H6R19_384 [Proteobacteria bacterium]|nr:hypothetical protein [Pseudomonadota bacterium]
MRYRKRAVEPKFKCAVYSNMKRKHSETQRLLGASSVSSASQKRWAAPVVQRSFTDNNFSIRLGRVV